MANRRHLAMLGQGVDAWNQWAGRRGEKADLRDADLTGRNLTGFDFTDADLKRAKLGGANLRQATFSNAYLRRTDLTGADLTEASLRAANCRHAVLHGATLKNAYLRRVDLSYVDLTEADMTGADLEYARFVDVKLDRATVKNCFIYGISVWNVRGTPKEQSNLIITPRRARKHDEAPQGGSHHRDQVITVDDLEVAQFVNLLLHNHKIRNVIDHITSKVVLVLGRFTDERKAVLDALRHTLRTRGLTPVLFDFTKPVSKDVTGTVETLARMARFVVADLTDPSSIPHELATVVPFLRTTPVVLLRLVGTTGYSMAKDLEAYDRWVIPVREYPDPEALIAGLDAYVIQPAETRLKVLRPAEQAQ